MWETQSRITLRDKTTRSKDGPDEKKHYAVKGWVKNTPSPKIGLLL